MALEARRRAKETELTITQEVVERVQLDPAFPNELPALLPGPKAPSDQHLMAGPDGTCWHGEPKTSEIKERRASEQVGKVNQGFFVFKGCISV